MNIKSIIILATLTIWSTVFFVDYQTYKANAGNMLVIYNNEQKAKVNDINEKNIFAFEEKNEKTIEEKILEAFGKDGKTALSIAKCESGLNPESEGDLHMKFHSYGLFQINQTWHKYDEKTLKNPDENIKIAKEIHDRWGNFNAWSCYKKIKK